MVFQKKWGDLGVSDMGYYIHGTFNSFECMDITSQPETLIIHVVFLFSVMIHQEQESLAQYLRSSHPQVYWLVAHGIFIETNHRD